MVRTSGTRWQVRRSRISLFSFAFTLQVRLESAGGEVIREFLAQLLLPIFGSLRFRCRPHKGGRLLNINRG